MSMLFEDRGGLPPEINIGRTQPTVTTQPSIVDQLTSQINQGTYQYGAIGDAFRAGNITEAQKNSLADLYYSSPVSRTDTNLQARQETWQDLGRTAPTLDPLEIVNTPSVEQVGMLSTTPDLSNMTWQDLEEQRLAGNPFSLDSGFVTADQTARQADLGDQGLMFQAGLGEDLFQDYNPNDQFTTGAMGDVLRSGSQADFKNLIDQGTVNRLAEMGLQAEYVQDEYRGYRYNPNTGQYDYYDNRPSMLEQAAPELIKAGITTALTGGLASGLSSATGLGIGTSTGLATGGMTLAQGGSVEDALVKGFTAGLGAEIKNIDNAVKAGTATQEMVAQAELLNNVKDVSNLVQAVESGNTLGAVTSGLSLAGVGTVKDVVGSGVNSIAEGSEFVADNQDAITEAVTAVVKGGIKADSTEEIIAKGLYEYVKNGGALPNIDLDLGDGWDTPEWLEAIDDEVLQPIKDSIVAGYQYVNDNVLSPALETVDKLVRELPTTKEDWQAAEDYVNANIIDPTVETVRETGRDVREAVDPVANVVRETGRDIEEAYGQAEDYVKEEIAPAVREVGRDIRDAMPDAPDIDFDLPDFSGLSMSLAGGTGGYTGGRGVNANLSELAKMRTQYGDQFVFEDLLSNPLLKNRFIS